jgi:transcriptional regulator with XRE-family HTH domain
MPAATTTRFGSLLRNFRKQAGLSQQQLAKYLAESPKRVSKWERGVSEPPGDPAFYLRLRYTPGFTYSDIALLLEAAEAVIPKDLANEFANQGTILGKPVRIRHFILSRERELVSKQDQAPSSSTFTYPDVDAILSPPMPHEVVEHGDHLTEHISDLQSQAEFGSEKERPKHYPHENVVFHVTQLQAEALGRQRTKKDSGQSYEVVATLKQAAQKTGVSLDEILTTRDIEADYHINKKLVQEYTKRGRQGHPHLTPLDVRLAGGGGGQLLFRRGDIERIVANPPKPGRTPK